MIDSEPLHPSPTNTDVGAAAMDPGVDRVDSVGSVSNVVDVELVVIGGAIAEKLGPELADRIAREACPRILLPGSKLKYVVAAFGTTPASSAPHPSGAPV